MIKQPLSDFFSCLLILLSVSILYSPVASFEFINFDDNVYITENPNVLGGMTWEGAKWAFTTTLGGHWHPITWLSHMLDITLFGLSAAASHVINAAIHGANACLLYFILRAVTLGTAVSLLSSLILAVHPMRLESVAWVAERKDVLSMFFGLLATILYVRFVTSRSLLLYVAGFFVFSLALLTKPTFVTLPLVWLLLDYCPLGRATSVRILLTEKLPFFLLALVSGIATILAQEHGGGLRSLAEVSLSSRFGIMFPGFLAYLGKLFWPSGLIIFYPRLDYPPGIVSGAFIGFAAVTWICIAYRQVAPQLLFGWLWFLVTLLPVSGMVAVGGQAFADRWTYLPHIGPIMALVSLGVDRYKFRAIATGACASLFFAFITFQNLPHWRSSEAVFSHALKVYPNNFMAHTNLGATLMETGRTSDASYHYEEAVRLNPTFPEALNNLGVLRAKQGRLKESLELFEKAISINPALTAAQNNRTQALSDLSLK